MSHILKRMSRFYGARQYKNRFRGQSRRNKRFYNQLRGSGATRIRSRIINSQ